MTVRLESEFSVKTQQTPKPAAQEPLEDPPLDDHSLEWWALFLDTTCKIGVQVRNMKMVFDISN